MRFTPSLAVPTPLLLAALALVGPAHAQDRLEQANPDRVEENRPDLPVEAPSTPPATRIDGTPAASAETAAQTVVLDTIRLTGLTELTDADFADVLAGYLGRPVTMADLKALANAVVQRARSLDYVFASARVPPQSVTDGTLVVEVDEGRIDGVRVEGYDQAYLHTLLDRLVTAPVTRARLERQLLLANDGLGISVGRSDYRRTAEGAFLTVKVQRDPLVGRVSLDNWGSRFVGPARARVSVGSGGVFDGADQLRLSLSTAPFQPREYGYGRLSYGRRLGASGTELSLSGSYGRTRPGASLRRFDTEGISRSVELSLSHPLLRSRAKSLWAEAGFGVRRSSQDQLGRTLRDDHFSNLSLGLFGLARLGDARVRGRVTAIRGLDLFGSTALGDPDASRSDGSARFTSLTGSLGVTVPVVPRVEIELVGEGQLASRPLLSSEEFGIGGADIGRGYDYSERLGDQGVAGVAELHYTLDDPPLMDRLQLLAFFDGGVTDDLGIHRFDGSIASTGGGVEAELPERITARLTVGVPLTGPRDAGTTRSPRVGFVLGKRF